MESRLFASLGTRGTVVGVEAGTLRRHMARVRVRQIKCCQAGTIVNHSAMKF